ncbi:MAG: hypothetical protein ACOYXT_27090 [Bacteroidota bacterium]
MRNRVLGVLIFVGIAGFLFYGINLWNNHRRAENQVSVIEKYGRRHNSERGKRHLPLIEEKWIVHDYDSSYVYWSNQVNRVNSSEPIHLSKTLYFKDSELISEEDIFHYENDGKTAFKLVVMIEFNESDSAKFEVIKYVRDGSYPPSKSSYVPFQTADSILVSWGFKDYYTNLRK